MRPEDLHRLPAGLPVPQDDGAAGHLPGLPLPPVALRSTGGGLVRLDQRPARWTVVYAYPRTGKPGEDPLGGLEAWNAIPGARGCTPQTCGYRDRHREILDLGAEVFGLSTQSPDYQSEMAARLRLPFEVLSDASLELTRALRLPSFTVLGQVLLKRLTLIISAGRIAHCFYPVFPPDGDAAQVIDWLLTSPGSARPGPAPPSPPRRRAPG